MAFGAVVESEFDAVYDKVKSALSAELQSLEWVLLRDQWRLVVERVKLKKGETDVVDFCGEVPDASFFESRSLEGYVDIKEEGADFATDESMRDDEFTQDDDRDVNDAYHDGDEKVNASLESLGVCDATSAAIPTIKRRQERQPKEKARRNGVDSSLMAPRRTKTKEWLPDDADFPDSATVAPTLPTSASSASRYKKYSCKSCPRSFSDKLSLARHTRWTHSTSIHSQRFDIADPKVNDRVVVERVDKDTESNAIKKSIRRQRRQRPSPEKLDLDSAEEEFESLTPKKTRKLSKRAQITPIPCILCELPFRSKIRLRKHLREAHLDRVVICPICQRTCDNFVEMTRHWKRDHRRDGRVELCDWCGRFCVDEEDFVNHAKEAHDQLVKVVTCGLCNGEFSLEAKLKHHLSSVHNVDVLETEESTSIAESKFEHKHTDEEKQNTRRKMCTVCGKSVTNLTEHVARLHRGDRSLSCKYCQETFASKSELGEHVKTAHSDRSKAMCDVCGKQFSNIHKARRHTVAVHLKEKCFCDVCGKECPHKEALYSHVIRNHSGKVYHCHICGQKFSLPENMKRHVQTVHIKTKISCADCGKEFTCKDHLRRHCKSVHEGKRHQCSHCEKNYSQAGDLHRHMKFAHGTLGANQMKMARASNVKVDAETVAKNSDVPVSATSKGLKQHENNGDDDNGDGNNDDDNDGDLADDEKSIVNEGILDGERRSLNGTFVDVEDDAQDDDADEAAAVDLLSSLISNGSVSSLPIFGIDAVVKRDETHQSLISDGQPTATMGGPNALRDFALHKSTFPPLQFPLKFQPSIPNKSSLQQQQQTQQQQQRGFFKTSQQSQPRRVHLHQPQSLTSSLSPDGRSTSIPAPDFTYNFFDSLVNHSASASSNLNHTARLRGNGVFLPAGCSGTVVTTSPLQFAQLPVVTIEQTSSSISFVPSHSQAVLISSASLNAASSSTNTSTSTRD